MTARHRERGAALVLALLVVALLMTLVLEFDRTTRLELRAAGNYRDETAAYYLANTGLAVARAFLQEDAFTSPQYDGLDEPWALPAGQVPVGDGAVAVSIVDEERKFPVNALILPGSGNAADPERVAQFRRLLGSLEIDEELVDAVLDWIDEDHNVRPSGAEDLYYRSLVIPAHPHNGFMDSVDELLFVKGVTPEIYGRLAPHLTSAVAVGGTFKVNVNTADREVLGALHIGLSEDVVSQLIAERPFESWPEVSAALGGGVLAAELNQFASVKSNYFTVQAVGLVHGATKQLTARLQRAGPLIKLHWTRVPS